MPGGALGQQSDEKMDDDIAMETNISKPASTAEAMDMGTQKTITSGMSGNYFETITIIIIVVDIVFFSRPNNCYTIKMLLKCKLSCTFKITAHIHRL